jgi:hypothetical protein
MQVDQPLSREQLMQEMRAFLADRDRGISQELFAEICGISADLLRKVFVQQNMPMTEMTQRRVNRGYAMWKQGYVRVMRRPDKKLYVEFRKKPEPAFLPTTRLRVGPDGVKLELGFRNRRDYSQR